MTTVSVRQIVNFPALLMAWDAHVIPNDVSLAYQQITTELDQSETPKYIIVDLTHNPNMPLSETLQGVLSGPHKHPMLKQWLVIGDHSVGHMVANVLTITTGKGKIAWFDTLENAYDHIKTEVNASTH